jgi:stress response protein YsnF
MEIDSSSVAAATVWTLAEVCSADRSLSDADQVFQERTIEAEERGEEAVVSKQARVTEEVVVRKEAEQRTETESATVRQTEVEVEDERGNTISGTGTTDRT